MTSPVSSAAARPRKRVLIVDDNALMRESIAGWIDRADDLEVCGAARSATEALRLLEYVRPDLIVTDLSMPNRSGFDLVAAICSRAVAPRVLILSMYSQSIHAERALLSGAAGYVAKGDGAEVLLAAIRMILAGGVYFDRPLAVRLRQRMAGSTTAPGLAAGEFSLLRRIGRTYPTATRRVAEPTPVVAGLMAAIRQKLGLRNDAALVNCALLCART